MATGQYFVGELAIQQGNIITGDSSTFTGGVGSWANWYGDASIADVSGKGRITGSTGGVLVANVATAGKRYKVSFLAKSISGSTSLKFTLTGASTGSDTVTITGTETLYTSELTANATGFYIFSDSGATVFEIDDVSVVEIPPLRGYDNGTKYLENSSAGVISTPSTQSYGEWEFSVYKGADDNVVRLNFISNQADAHNATGHNGYLFQFESGENVTLYTITNGAVASTPFTTAASYIAINTWYRMKITRTAAGVFTVLIKGGAFTPTTGYDGWTLVQPTGESLSGDPLVYTNNPVTDNTYKTSQFLVVDNDASDRISRIITRSENIQ